MDRGIKQGMQGNCKIWAAEPSTPLFAYQWWGRGSCLLKPKWVWNVCSLLNDILTTYDETFTAVKQRTITLYPSSSRTFRSCTATPLCFPSVQTHYVQFKWAQNYRQLFNLSPPEYGTVLVMQMTFYKVILPQGATTSNPTSLMLNSFDLS